MYHIYSIYYKLLLLTVDIIFTAMSGIQDWFQSEEMRRMRQEMSRDFYARWRLLNQRYGITVRVSKVQAWGQANPALSLFIIATLFVCALPLLCLITASVCATFIFITAFLLFEGMLRNVVLLL